jgi:hypothetical protein
MKITPPDACESAKTKRPKSLSSVKQNAMLAPGKIQDELIAGAWRKFSNAYDIVTGLPQRADDGEITVLICQKQQRR